MAKDDRKIVSAIRMPAERGDDGRALRGTRAVFKEGDEDALAKAASKEQLQSFFDSGAITGDTWGLKATPEEGEAKTSTKSAKK